MAPLIKDLTHFLKYINCLLMLMNEEFLKQPSNLVFKMRISKKRDLTGLNFWNCFLSHICLNLHSELHVEINRKEIHTHILWVCTCDSFICINKLFCLSNEYKIFTGKIILKLAQVITLNAKFGWKLY